MALDSKKIFAGEIIATKDILCTLMDKPYFNYILKEKSMQKLIFINLNFYYNCHLVLRFSFSSWLFKNKLHVIR